MTGFPRRASDLLHVFGVDEALIGDLEESAYYGRSRWWRWYQTAGAIALSSCHQALARPWTAARGIALGWAAMLTTFATIDAPFLDGLRLTGYRTGEWTAFWLAAGVLSYAGFGLSAWVVARFHRRTPTLIVWYTATVLAALVLSATVTALRAEPTAVPHALFPLVSVTLPYQWRSGLILAPGVMLLTGMLTLRHSRLKANAGSRNARDDAT